MQSTYKVSEERYGQAFFLAPEAVAINRLADGLYVSINRVFTQAMGYGEADVLGKTSIEKNIWADLEDRNRMVQLLRKDGQVSNFEARFRTKSGSVLNGIMSAEVISLGGTPHILSFTRDIASLMLAEAKQRQSEERFKRLADDIPAFIVTFSPDGTLTFANEVIARLVNMVPSKLIGMNFFNFLHPIDREMVRSRLAQLTPEEPIETHEQTFLESGGHCAYHQWTNRAIFDSMGKLTHYQSVGEDITERKLTEKQRRDQYELLQVILATAQDAYWLADTQGKLLDLNQAACVMLGYSKAEFLGMNVSSIDVVDSQEVVDSRIQRMQQRGGDLFESRHRRKDGSIIDVEVSIRLLPTKDAFSVFVRDITQRKLAEVQMQLYASVFGQAREGIAITDAQGNIIDVNAAFTRVTGYTRSEAIGQNPRILKSGRQEKVFYEAMWHALYAQGHWSGEVWNRRKNGEVYAELLTISAVRDDHGHPLQYVALFSDISDIKEQQQRLEQIAHFDALTHLPNRVLLADRLSQGLLQVQRRGKKLAVVYLDLDGFKSVNDRHGHYIGDKLLIALANAMKAVMREGDTLARIGGDEFVAVLIDLDGAASCDPLLSRLLEVASKPVEVAGHLLQVSASLGVTFYPQSHEMDGDQLLRQADQAMYQAKVAGKNRFCIFDVGH